MVIFISMFRFHFLNYYYYYLNNITFTFFYILFFINCHFKSTRHKHQFYQRSKICRRHHQKIHSLMLLKEMDSLLIKNLRVPQFFAWSANLKKRKRFDFFYTCFIFGFNLSDYIFVTFRFQIQLHNGCQVQKFLLMKVRNVLLDRVIPYHGIIVKANGDGTFQVKNCGAATRHSIRTEHGIIFSKHQSLYLVMFQVVEIYLWR